MDKTILAVGVIAVIAILATTLILNPFPTESSAEKKEPQTQSDTLAKDKQGGSDDDSDGGSDGQETQRPPRTPIEVTEDELDNIIKPKITGDCTLYKHVVKDRYQCFGTAGNYSIMATNEYRPTTNSTEYYCRPTEYGCRLYQKVDFHLG